MLKAKKTWYLYAVAGLLAGCTVSYSNPPTGSAAASTSNFSSTSPAVATMNALRTAFIQQTVQARDRPGAETTNTPSSFSTVAVTPTTGQSTQAANTPTVATPAATNPVIATPTPGLPDTYKIHEGETIWCLARRFNIDPNDILAANGNKADVYPDNVINIPKNGKPFPGDRALHAHTPNMTHVVQAPNDTIYKIGCYYGDVDPDRIIAANGLKDPYTLTLGQKILIP